MLSCDACLALMADSLYGPLVPSEELLLKQHLRDCTDCQLALKELEAAKASIEQAGFSGIAYDDIPERSKLNELWLNLQPALDKIDAERYRSLSRRRSLPVIGGLLAIAASVILTIGLRSTPTEPLSSPPELSINELISPDLMNYLNRAQVMLLLVANTESDNMSAVPIRQRFAHDMALEANVLNTGMEHNFNSGQSKLLKDIEFLLLQIANLDESNMDQGVELMQQYIEENSVLFRIRLLEMREQDSFI